MSETTAVRTRRPARFPRLPVGDSRPSWLPAWSNAAAMRAVRATLVVPGVFALAYFVIGDLQAATFAAFGGFATLVLASFGGTRRDKLLAHLGLALAGSVLLVIGTAVNATPLLATLVTVPVAFVVLFAGVTGPNAASAGTAALLAYILPAASPGTMSMIPSRLEGWWMASVAGTLAVLLLAPRSPGTVLKDAAGATARALADQLDAALRGDDPTSYREASVSAKRELLATFTETPYRPTGLATADQALENLVGLLEWSTTVVCDSLREYSDLRRVDDVERRLLAETGVALRTVATLLRGDPAQPDLDRLERRLAESVGRLSESRTEGDDYREAVHLSFHTRTAAVVAHTAVADALIVSRRADPAIVSGRRRRWYGVAGADALSEPAGERGLPGLATAAGLVSRHASLRSVWLLNSIRGAVALAVAVGVADLTGVGHGFWVVLGTLSVLRTNAAATGATAMRALLGTAVGFVVGAFLLLAIGTDATALWTALPIAVLVASYAPGVLPFAAGQAAFTILVSVLFNLLAPAGWQIGVIRIEDVALGCLVSLVVGVLFWPRGAAALVADDLADAFRTGGAYLAGAADWALGLRRDRPGAATAIDAGARLDDALRGFLSEQGAKRVPKEDVWRLVGGTLRVRLTAHSLAGLPNPETEPNALRLSLARDAGQLAAWYDHLASRLDRTDHGDVPLLAPPESPEPPVSDDLPVRERYCLLWVGQHLEHITPHLAELVEPARVVATQRHLPWWR